MTVPGFGTIEITDTLPIESPPNPYGWRWAAFAVKLEDGATVMVVAVEPDSVTDPELNKIMWARLICNATGECVICGAVRRKPNREERRRLKREGADVEAMEQAVIEHEHDCPAADDNLHARVTAIYGLGSQ
jgi:hypothetical protein